jgi:hypothetical protein
MSSLSLPLWMSQFEMLVRAFLRSSFTVDVRLRAVRCFEWCGACITPSDGADLERMKSWSPSNMSSRAVTDCGIVSSSGVRLVLSDVPVAR